MLQEIPAPFGEVRRGLSMVRLLLFASRGWTLAAPAGRAPINHNADAPPPSHADQILKEIAHAAIIDNRLSHPDGPSIGSRSGEQDHEPRKAAAHV